MTIEVLLRAVPPPAEPFEAFDGPWDLIEKALRTALPQDYKDFVRIYGSGYFMELVRIPVARSREPLGRLVTNAEFTSRTFFPEDLGTYSFWPTPGGFIPFGSTDFGDQLLWLPRGEPDNWRVVVWGRGFGTYETFDCDMTGFLAGLATGDILPEEFPEILPCEHLFTPRSLL